MLSLPLAHQQWQQFPLGVGITEQTPIYLQGIEEHSIKKKKMLKRMPGAIHKYSWVYFLLSYSEQLTTCTSAECTVTWGRINVKYSGTFEDQGVDICIILEISTSGRKYCIERYSLILHKTMDIWFQEIMWIYANIFIYSLKSISLSENVFVSSSPNNSIERCAAESVNQMWRCRK